jgi:RimJ/RimL family protein N-acetyltransferase
VPVTFDIELRGPLKEDLECYYEVFSDKDTHHFIINEGLLDFEGSEKKLNTLIKINGDTKKVFSIINDGVATGFIVIHLDNSKTPFISYAIRRSYWRKGLASKAIDKLIEIERGNFDGFKAATHLENLASQGLLRKLNFRDLGQKEFEMGKRILFEFIYNSSDKNI